MSDTTETVDVADINKWLDSTSLKWSDMRDHFPEQALECLPEISQEAWLFAIVEPARTLLVRWSHPGSEEMIGLLFQSLNISALAPTAAALATLGAGSDVAAIQTYLAGNRNGCVIALDRNAPWPYPLP